MNCSFPSTSALNTTAALAALLTASPGPAAMASTARSSPVDPLRESVITEVVNQVNVVAMPSRVSTPARANERFVAPNRIVTGRRSRCQLEARDGTVTRAGSNTRFSFGAEDRAIHLERGSLLFYSPSGRGGGTVHTAAATATVIGTTIIVVATPDGGFKVLCLEGVAEVAYPDRRSSKIDAGEMTFVLPAQQKGRWVGRRGGPVLTFDLKRQSRGSILVRGFDRPLPSLPAIEEAIGGQEKRLARGRLTETGLLVAGAGPRDGEVELVDPTVARIALAEGASGTEVARLERALSGGARMASATPPAAYTFGAPGISVGGEFARFPIEEVDVVSGLVARWLVVDNPVIDFSGMDRLMADAAGGAALPPGGVEVAVAEDFGGFPEDAPTALEKRELSLVARDRVELARSVDFVGFDFARRFSILSGDRIEIAPGAIVRAAFSGQGAETSLWIYAGGDVRWTDVSLGNASGDIEVKTGESIAFHGVVLDAARDVRLQARRDLNLSGGSDLRGVRAELAAGRDLVLDGVALGGPALEAHAHGKLTLRAADLAGLASVSLSARTLALSEIDFPSGSSVLLRSENGRLAPGANTGRDALPGFVNFIREVKYGGRPAQDFVSQDVGGKASVGAPVQLAPR